MGMELREEGREGRWLLTGRVVSARMISSSDTWILFSSSPVQFCVYSDNGQRFFY